MLEPFVTDYHSFGPYIPVIP